MIDKRGWWRRLAEEGRGIGFPLLVKAVLGGGGKGMKLARAPDDLEVCARPEIIQTLQSQSVWPGSIAAAILLQSGGCR